MKLDYTPEEKQRLISRMALDIFFFAEFILGDEEQPEHYHIRCKSPDFHREIADEIRTMVPGDKLGVVAPRGHAKTTFLTLVVPLHRILFGKERFILFISESESQSEKHLKTLSDEIEYNEKLIYFFGDRKGKTYKRKWGVEEIEICMGFKNDDSGNTVPKGFCDVMIRGTGQKVRGLKYGPYRPTMTICDDGEGEANTTTPEQRMKFRRWVNAAVIPGSDDAIYVELCTIVDDDSHLNRICGPKAYDKNGNYIVKGWRHLFYQAILQDVPPGGWISEGKEILDENGVPKVLWPERKSYEWLMNERERLKSEGDEQFWFQEYQNIPIDETRMIFKRGDIIYWTGSYLFDGGINYLKIDNKVSPVNIFIGVDPASSENVKADYTVIMVVAVSGIRVDGKLIIEKYRVVDYFRDQVSPMDGADELIRLCKIYHPKSVRIEKTGHAMLSDYMRRYKQDNNESWNLVPEEAVGSKHHRIISMQPLFGQHLVEIRNTHTELERELVRYTKFTKEKKDTLDALFYATRSVYPPGFVFQKGKWEKPSMDVSYDWQTGQMKINGNTVL